MIRRSLFAVSLIAAMIISLLGIGSAMVPGIPRHELLIVDALDGRVTNPRQMNPYIPGTSLSNGLHNLAYDHLWDINTVTGEWINSLAAAPPEPLNEDYTKWRIYLREGLKWSDGVEFTAEDVVFTFEMLTTNEKLPAYGYWSDFIEKAEVVDRYTVDVTTKRPYAKLQTALGVVVWGNGFYPVPKHIWENVDPATFDNYNPVVLGPYTLHSVDPNGFWALYQKRDDWYDTSVGRVAGEPKPKYVLFIAHGTEERRVLAGIQHQLDVFMDITPESWEVLRNRNSFARAWYDDFPYAWMDDPCERGITFNLLEAPYNSANVRWALTLATNIEEVALATFDGMVRISPLHIPPINVFQDIYFKELEPWLESFTLPDGYQPFDTTVGQRMAELFRARGYDIPTDPEGAEAIFGIGWWKYDPEKAAELLEAEGFRRNAQGRWVKPDGELWRMTIVSPSNYEIQSNRLAFAVADQWRKFGIDVNVQPMEQGTFWTAWPNGTYDAGSYWPGCGQIPDLYDWVNDFSSDLIVPTGQPAPGNQIRFSDDRIDAILAELEQLLPTDPRNIELGLEALKVFVEQMPYIPMVGTSKFVPVDTYYWTGWPTADNHYDNPIWWWSGFKFVLPYIEPTGRR